MLIFLNWLVRIFTKANLNVLSRPSEAGFWGLSLEPRSHPQADAHNLSLSIISALYPRQMGVTARKKKQLSHKVLRNEDAKLKTLQHLRRMLFLSAFFMLVKSTQVLSRILSGVSRATIMEFTTSIRDSAVIVSYRHPVAQIRLIAHCSSWLQCCNANSNIVLFTFPFLNDGIWRPSGSMYLSLCFRLKHNAEIGCIEALHAAWLCLGMTWTGLQLASGVIAIVGCHMFSCLMH